MRKIGCLAAIAASCSSLESASTPSKNAPTSQARANAGRLSAPAVAVDAPTQLDDDLERLASMVDLPVTVAVVLATLAAWTQLFGLLSFELSNQTRGVVEDHAALFEATTRLGALSIGLKSTSV